MWLSFVVFRGGTKLRNLVQLFDNKSSREECELESAGECELFIYEYFRTIYIFNTTFFIKSN